MARRRWRSAGWRGDRDGDSWQASSWQSDGGMYTRFLTLTLVLALCECSAGKSLSPPDVGNTVADVRVPVTETRAGDQYRVELAAPVDGEPNVFTVFEPTALVAGGIYPLVLQGEGFGDARINTRT